MFRASELKSNAYTLPSLSELRQIITNNYIVDENEYLNELLTLVDEDETELLKLRQDAINLINRVREETNGGDSIDKFLQEYSLDTQEGIVLMCLAEALLRIPDAATADALIKDKLSSANWKAHLKRSGSMLVNASTWGLLLTGKILQTNTPKDQLNALDKLVNRLGEPVVRKAMYAAMQIMGKQFVLGRSIEEALKHSRSQRTKGYTHSYDMLGEAALTNHDAQRYFDAYASAIKSIGAESIAETHPALPTISIKLSALHPRYEVANEDRVLTELYQRVVALVELARDLNVAISVDAEEMNRLELSLSLFEKVYQSPQSKGWGGLGLVVQAYSKRALPVLMWINQLANAQGDAIPVRLVKGAYWDSEIKWSQEMGIASYPVYTRKASTDVSYLACAHFLLSDHTKGNIFPQFATHNAHTLLCIKRIAGDREMEFQRLHGMGEELYDTVLSNSPNMNVRIYAPVGAHKDLLPYLVRRLLENGANSSFVHKLVDPNTPVESLVEHPLESLKGNASLANDKIPLPPQIFGSRKNSQGTNLDIESLQKPFLSSVETHAKKQWHGGPIVDGEKRSGGEKITVTSPQNREHQVGEIYWATPEETENAVFSAHRAFRSWNRRPIEERASLLEKLADELEANEHELIALCTMEAGKSLQDGIDEVREAVDFCRFYAIEGRKLFNADPLLPGPTGERNEIFVSGKGVFVCISPWNFPLAIFLGQISAALVTGNTVIAKSAEQTGLVAHRTIELMLKVGFPKEVIQFLPGKGSVIGPQLTDDTRIAGVCFTGSTGTAKRINISLAQRDGAIATLIAETGGQNAMIVDSTSLPEQVVTDALASAFKSAGQRCSALRVMYVQDDVADRVLELLDGAMQELSVGDPLSYKTDVGPVIDHTAQASLTAHIEAISRAGKLISTVPMPEMSKKGSYVQPSAIEIDSIKQLDKEHFGPILHIIRFKAKELDVVIDEINGTGFGLTLGIHSRNESFAFDVADRIDVGNVYINRNQVGAIVGVQPFGGQGLSGTGPKAGGPHYLTRFVTEKTYSNNVTAIGGNTTLLSLGD
ncbi:bifunctional proline dehydrogenase/L-glutamate gamma-semialdehyde dehydrogenase PutA [Alteromonas sp. a30]|uniref:bifunctional proline dehydrogenase/L-glutamate gamma-semialdehyde dehydrogenase PutA n=1 Tax=Alteromonas sp. a30 TaxID=2730917 RepID=UPI00227EF514|nr:bifunctional proline dehydrogenase/L-glutamate gamma-semialdehyde dehydrogenase PutA [Alteromonas sp. a30]MCY7294278.1 bifunctional proline dehydrogenase/L-glutamate gamma-semialdehyde dehydrogenase PutA [Alteromonas sp. a30]